MYTTRNFPTKRALKEAVARRLANDDSPPVTVYQPGPFSGNEPTDGWVSLEGPHYPSPHTWYATALLRDGIVIKVK
jgi:hypothetical protein